jgi:predicted MFS family arabinose efflux permease
MDRRLLVLALGMFALGTDSYVMAGVLPQLARTFDVTIGVAGQMTTVYAVTYALMCPTLAAVAAGIPRKGLLLAGLAVFIVANLLTAGTSNLAIALAARVLAGLGASMFSPTAAGSAAALAPTEKRGAALSVVAAGLAGATALGAPIGTLIGGLGDWRWTMVFVSALASVAGLGVLAMPSNIPLPPKTTLAERLKPLADPRVASTLACTLLLCTGLFSIYTYFTVVFERVVDGSALVLVCLMVLWGACGTLCNLIVGRFIDAIGSRLTMTVLLVDLTVSLASLPWARDHLWSSVIAIAGWGCAAWGTLAPQQHRLVAAAPHSAPVVIGLNTSAIYLGATLGGVVGALAIAGLGTDALAFIAAGLAAFSLVFAEFAARNPPSVVEPDAQKIVDRSNNR